MTNTGGRRTRCGAGRQGESFDCWFGVLDGLLIPPDGFTGVGVEGFPHAHPVDDAEVVPANVDWAAHESLNQGMKEFNPTVVAAVGKSD